MWRKILQSRYRRNSERRRSSENDWCISFQGELANIWGWIEEYIDMWVEHIHENGGSEEVQSHLPGEPRSRT